jgi:hypothetical protein
MTDSIFEPNFLYFLNASVDLHHHLYPAVPPQGIYFESLVERTFREINKPMTVVKVGGTTQPRYDILFEGHRIFPQNRDRKGYKSGLDHDYKALHDGKGAMVSG